MGGDLAAAVAAGRAAGAVGGPGGWAIVVAVDRNRLAELARGPAADWKGKVLLLARGAGAAGDEMDVIRGMGQFLKQAHAAGAVAVIDALEGSAMHLTRVDSADLRGVYSPTPVVRLAPEHQAILSRLMKRGRRPRIWIDVQNRVSPGAVETANVVGEIEGADAGGEIVLLSAHLDFGTWGRGPATMASVWRWGWFPGRG